MDRIRTGKAGPAGIAGGGAARFGGVRDLRRAAVLSAVCLLVICVSACSAARQTGSPDNAAAPAHMRCAPLKEDPAGRPALSCFFGFEQSNIFTPTGRKVTIRAESGERLELWWVVDWLEGGKWLPRWTYLLYYLPPCGKDSESCPRRRIGECHFSEGCNFGRFTAPDANGNSVPDSFSGIAWDSWDYGDDDGVEGYLDHVRHTYDPSSGLYEVKKYLYHYPPACSMPMSPREDVCLVKKECQPPYRIFKEEVMESRYLDLKK